MSIAGPKMSPADFERASGGMTGSAAAGAWPMRPIALFTASSAPTGCLRVSQCTDSGTAKYTTGMSTAVTIAPK